MTAQLASIDRYYNGVFVKEGTKDTWSQTYSGRRMSILNPQPEDIYIEDIAAAISKQCRFNGHCKSFYSVGQHCIYGSELAFKYYDREVAKEFLLHDATEAFVGDLVRPVKVHLPEFETIEQRFWKAIATRFNLPLLMSEECKYIDDVMVTWEKRDLLPNSEDWPKLPDISHLNLPTLNCLSWEHVEWAYLKRYKELFDENFDLRY